MTSDPFTISVIQAGLSAAADEMFAVLKKTAMSPIIYEVLDVGTGVTDPGGEIVSSGAGIPGFVGVLDKAVKRIVALHEGTVQEGDVFVTNDPYWGGVTHLNDVVVAQPVFAEGRLVAWTASIAHWNDVGGMTPGSMPADATEIFQEGLRLPCVRLFEAGRKIQPVFDIIAANSRLPDFASGDLWAQISAGRRAARPIQKMAESYGADVLQEAIEAAFAEGEARALAGLKSLPKGTYHAAVEQDGGEVWTAEITIAEDSFTVDLRDAPEQKAAPHNTSADGTRIACQLIFKVLTDPALFANAGSFRPLKVLTRPGSIFEAEAPAPHGYYSETRIRLSDMLWQAMAQVMPDRLPAGHFASICGTVIAGRHPDTQRPFTMVEPQMGGWGATATRDGLDAMYSTNHGDTFNCPVEICEARYGIDVGWRRLSDSTAGQGRHRGGRGLSTCYRPRGEAKLSVGYSHTRVPVWGGNGGVPGGRNSVTLQRAEGGEDRFAFASGVVMRPGDALLIETANGGGWGAAPAERQFKKNGGTSQ
ncbi:hydantoinase B/oxoprolinase family protein [Pseudoroseicyclus aestuarii]|uniref:N-methylhydantoinase B n=1 Tax=Pseudoroseicyclus aestuarii TaxID=1795041 RepID=A0A318T566_9RHOB|nr:hydantoinase B/oxoprolinase family protein [Pseudoroseicyclus aestuarii]PYE82431.1 N-methylhydantoinase B [Pseudoroseicyclus aestuarii]